jgi:hypothetical protein
MRLREYQVWRRKREESSNYHLETHTMTEDHFVKLLELELRRRFARFSLADLQTFVADVWPVAQADPDVDRWTRAFLDSGRCNLLA